MKTVTMTDFYYHSSKYELLKCYLFMQDCISNNDTNSIHDVISYAIEMMSSKPSRILHWYHYQLLNVVFKSTSYGSGTFDMEETEKCTRGLLLQIDLISTQNEMIVHKSFLKLLLTMYRCCWQICKRMEEAPKMITEWFLRNRLLFLNKYFLKLFKSILQKNDVDISNICGTIFVVLKEKGYQQITLRNKQDIFIDMNSSTVFTQCQAQALEILMSIITSLLQSGHAKSFNEMVVDMHPPNSTDTVQQYIKSHLLDDDILLLSNLIAVTKLYESLLFGNNIIKLDNGWHKYLLTIGNTFYWFSYFLSYLNFDHKIVIDWLLDENEQCESYLKLIISHISINFHQFINFFDTNNYLKETELEYTMDFLIRLNLSVRDINTYISNLIDEVERQYELMGDNMISADPLSSVLTLQFSSQCSIDEISNISEEIPALVVYSDSD